MAERPTFTVEDVVEIVERSIKANAERRQDAHDFALMDQMQPAAERQLAEEREAIRKGQEDGWARGLFVEALHGKRSIAEEREKRIKGEMDDIRRMWEWEESREAEKPGPFRGAFSAMWPVTHPKPAATVETLSEAEALEALIPCIRESAQGTLDALSRAGYVIVKKA